jgi:hypothetical protein
MKYIYLISLSLMAFILILSANSFAALPTKPRPTTSNLASQVKTKYPIAIAPKTTIRPGYSIPPMNSYCPANTYIITGTKMCTDGTSLYALFSDAIVTKCVNAGGGSACTNMYSMKTTSGIYVSTQRINLEFYKALSK